MFPFTQVQLQEGTYVHAREDSLETLAAEPTTATNADEAVPGPGFKSTFDAKSLTVSKS